MQPEQLQKSYLWDLSQKLISHNTVSNRSNLACSELLADHLENQGFQVNIVKDQIDGKMKSQVVAQIGPMTPNGLILSGHMDIVPFENQPGWTKDPLVLTLEQDKIFGRGTTDMKLFIAQCLVAFKEIDLKKLQRPILCLFTCDEEVGCQGAKRLTKTLPKLLNDFPLPKRAIIGEPTSFEIINTHKGLGLIEIIFKGKAGHSSRPDLGKNAIIPLGETIQLIEKLNLKFRAEVTSEVKKDFPDFPYNHFHMAKVSGGLASNMIPEQSRLLISYRSLPHEPGDLLFNFLKEQLSQLDFYPDIELKLLRLTEPLKKSFNPELESALKEIAQKSILRGAPFTTDAGPFSTLGIESYIWGPGLLEMAHKADEYIPLKEFIQGPGKIQRLIQNLLISKA